MMLSKEENGNLQIISKFAKALASNELKIRNVGFKKVCAYLVAKSQDPLAIISKDMKLLWKGLFYCLWMSDKPLVQEDLAKRMANVILRLHSIEGSQIYFQEFLSTMQREWNGIDRLRMDKFYLLFRFMINNIFQLFQSKNWNEDLIQWFIDLLQEGPLHPEEVNSRTNPLGIRYHICDIYVDELESFACDELDGNILVNLLQPFCLLLQKSKINDLCLRVEEKVFQVIIDKSKPAVELLNRVSTLKVEPMKLNFDYQLISESLFKHAGVEGIRSINRSRIYKLVKKFKELSSGMLALDEFPDLLPTEDPNNKISEDTLVEELIKMEEEESKKRKEEKKLYKKKMKVKEPFSIECIGDFTGEQVEDKPKVEEVVEDKGEEMETEKESEDAKVETKTEEYKIDPKDEVKKTPKKMQKTPQKPAINLNKKPETEEVIEDLKEVEEVKGDDKKLKSDQKKVTQKKKKNKKAAKVVEEPLVAKEENIDDKDEKLLVEKVAKVNKIETQETPNKLVNKQDKISETIKEVKSQEVVAVKDNDENLKKVNQKKKKKNKKAAKVVEEPLVTEEENIDDKDEKLLVEKVAKVNKIETQGTPNRLVNKQDKISETIKEVKSQEVEDNDEKLKSDQMKVTQKKKKNKKAAKVVEASTVKEVTKENEKSVAEDVQSKKQKAAKKSVNVKVVEDTKKISEVENKTLSTNQIDEAPETKDMKKKTSKVTVKSDSTESSEPTEAETSSSAPSSQTKKKRKRKSSEITNKNSSVTNEINLSVKKMKQPVEGASSIAPMFKVPDFDDDDEQLPAFIQKAAQKIKLKKTKAVSKSPVGFKTPSKNSLITPKKRVSFSIGHNKVKPFRKMEKPLAVSDNQSKVVFDPLVTPTSGLLKRRCITPQVKKAKKKKQRRNTIGAGRKQAADFF